MFYTQLRIGCAEEYTQMLIAELSEIGFDTFLETEGGFEAYSEAENFDKTHLDTIVERYSLLTPITISADRIQKRNWNEDWEKSYQPIDVDGRCLIRAEFHKPEKAYPFEIIITPKMSFGTGHHQTTYLMIRHEMDMDLQGKRVLDAGCGTGILSIMACKLGASEVHGFDIDEWSVVNANENIRLNDCPDIVIEQGRISGLAFDGQCDVVLANINKNVLMDEMSLYASRLNARGQLLLSGFYTRDMDELLQEAVKCGMTEVRRDEKDDWACMLLSK